MSSVRDEIIKDWGTENGSWVISDEAVTLHEPHQRIDNNNERITEFARKERGFWCDECHSKCTLGPGLETEYGHYGGCSHRNVDRIPSNKKGKD